MYEIVSFIIFFEQKVEFNDIFWTCKLVILAITNKNDINANMPIIKYIDYENMYRLLINKINYVN